MIYNAIATHHPKYCAKELMKGIPQFLHIFHVSPRVAHRYLIDESFLISGTFA